MVTDNTAPIDSRGNASTPHRRSTRLIAVVGCALGVAAFASGCSSSSKSAAPSTTTTSGSSTTTVATVPAATTPAKSGGQSSGSGTTSPPSGPAPVIASFVTPDNIDCHNGNFQMFSASWTTTNAVKTTISIDGAGIYKTYAANGSDSLPFNCSTAHTFLLTAYGAGGHTTTKTITLQPRNVQATTTTT